MPSIPALTASNYLGPRCVYLINSTSFCNIRYGSVEQMISDSWSRVPYSLLSECVRYARIYLSVWNSSDFMINQISNCV